MINKNFCFSKALKRIDLKLKFKDIKEEKSFLLLNQLKKGKRERLLLLQRKYNHNEILYNLKKAYDENRILLNIKGKYINDETNKKEQQFPSFLGPTKIEKNKEKKEDNNLLIEENKDQKPIQFDNTWKEEYLKRLKGKKDNPDLNKSIDNENENKNDIFDKNYKKIKHKKTEKGIMLEKIRENNLRVQSRLKIYKELMDKFSERKEYTPNYIFLEKHTPIIRLDSSSKRIFPYKFIKNNNYSSVKRIFKKKLFKNNSYVNFYKNNNSINPCLLFNSSPKKSSFYTTISKSILNNNNNYFIKGFQTKNEFENRIIFYKF